MFGGEMKGVKLLAFVCAILLVITIALAINHHYTSKRAKVAKIQLAREQAALKAEEARQQEQAAAEKRVAQDADNVLKNRLLAQITNMLKDPGSAQFQGVGLNAARTALCGRVNAKNSMGGYIGFSSFIVTTDGQIGIQGDGGGFEAAKLNLDYLLLAQKGTCS